MLCCACMLSPRPVAETYVMAVADYAPFTKEDDSGMLDLVFDQIIDRARFEYRIEKMPVSRFINSYASEEFPVQFGVKNNLSEKDIQRSHFIPLFDVSIKFVYLKQREELNRPLDQMRGITAASILGPDYQARLFDRLGIRKLGTQSVKQSIKLVLGERADIALCIPLACFEAMNELGAGAQKLTLNQAAIHSTTAGFFISRAMPDAGPVFHDLRVAIDAYLRSENYGNLLREHLGEPIPKEYSRYRPL